MFSQKLFLAYLISLVIGTLTIYPIMRYIFKEYELDEQIDTLKLALYVGILERSIYTTAILLGSSEVIAGWLALKAAANLKAPVEQETNNKGLKNYYAFLLGNGLSLAFGIGGGVLVKSVFLS